MIVTNTPHGEHLARVTGSPPVLVHIEPGPLAHAPFCDRQALWAPLDAPAYTPAGSTQAFLKDGRLTLHPNTCER